MHSDFRALELSDYNDKTIEVSNTLHESYRRQLVYIIPLCFVWLNDIIPISLIKKFLKRRIRCIKKMVQFKVNIIC